MSGLQVEGLTKTFGGLVAVAGVSLVAEHGRVLGLFGPNGAGKTTLFNLISGALRPDGGRVLLDGVDITHLPAHKRAQRGLARTFQIVKPLNELSVLENIMVPLARESLRRLLPLGRYRTPAREEQASALLERVGLQTHALAPAGSLPLGMKKRLEVARALALKPKVLLLDEPLAGLSLKDAQLVLEVVSTAREEAAVVLIEHNVRLAMAACDHAVVMEAGAEIASGAPEAVKRDQRVIDAYLGESFRA
ncbi:MAG: ABC transporter ATP-binding protein [Syntrophobacteraceae bacterium]